MDSIRLWMTLGGESKEQIGKILGEVEVVQAGCSRWRRVSGGMCDKRVSARAKGKAWKTMVGAVMLCDLESWR